jgi:predicted nucleic acid-binding Zn ribbon protein
MVDGTGLAAISDEPGRVYESMRKIFLGAPSRRRKKISDENQPYAPGRDPLQVSNAMRELTGSLGWDPALAEAKLYVEWPHLVGEGIAEHATPVNIVDRKLTLQASSSAWATQLRLMRHELLTVLADKLPEVPIDHLTVLAPGAPSWKSGPRSVPGRGPRDTYG